MTASPDRLVAALADRYTIEQEIGAGGMATVYLAHDRRHDRKVAVKVLNPELAAVIGAERFLQEIRVTANLQHPNILSLYDSGEADSFLYYVMPFVEGESLRGRLNREKQLSVEETLHITRAVAAALDYAHRHDVIHRDIKPDNILLHDGQPLVADFGIALAVTEAGGTRMTATGLSVGTPHYMSPEQAMGEHDLDRRSDIYSLACVTYEMLTGEPPHTGPSAQAIVAKILTEPPRPVGESRPATPAPLAAALDRALQKLPADRFSTAETFSAALTDPKLTVRTAAATPGRSRTAIPALGAAVAVVGAFLLGRIMAVPSDMSDPFLTQFSIHTPEGNIPGRASTRFVGISRDGSRVAYAVDNAGGDQLFVRHLNSLEAQPIPAIYDPGSPTFTSDGESIIYQDPGGQIRRVPLTGGSPETLGTGPPDFSYTDDGSIVLGAGTQLWAVGVARMGTGRIVMRLHGDGGDPEQLTALDTAAGEIGHFFPQLLPGNRLLLTVQRNPYFGGTLVAVIDLADGERTNILPGAVRARYTPTGHLVWVESDGRLRASAFDLDRLELTGRAVTVAEEVSGGTADQYPQFDVSDQGHLVYVPAQPRELVMVDRTGRTSPIIEETRFYHSPRFSPDGRRIAMDITDDSGRDIWVLDVADRTPLKVTFTGTANDPIWHPAGRSVTFGMAHGSSRGIFSVPADGSDSPDSIFVGGDHDRTPGSWHPSGDRLVAIGVLPAGWRLETVGLADSDSGFAPLAGARPLHAFPAVSPDGRWLAYQSSESGRAEVFVRPLEGSEGRVLISREGGTEPVWSRSGQEIFYRHGGGTSDVLMAARVDAGPPFRVLERTELFSTGDVEAASPHANYDVHPDGERFVMVRLQGGTEIVYIQNWTRLLEEQ